MASLAEVARAGSTSQPGTKRYKSMKDRIQRNITEDADGCWIWQRKIQTAGYGQINLQINGRPVTRLAHRVSYEAFVGPIPTGLWIDHLCRVRSCVNPAHLEPVTPQQNVWRSPIHAAHSRSRGECPKGHVLAQVGTYKIRGYDVCKPCNRASTAKYRAKKAAAKAGGDDA